MKIEDVRPSFTVYLVGDEAGPLGGIEESLSLAGYVTVRFAELEDALAEIPENPPHFVLFDAAETEFSVKKAIRQINAQLPESHVYLVAPAAERETVTPMLDRGVYDVILTPVASETELVRKLDRAAERDYFMYLNEKLSETQPAQNPDPPAEPANDFVRDLFAQKSGDETIEVFLRHLSAACGDAGALYLKYFANRRLLVAHRAHGMDKFDLQGLGVNFNESATAFRASQLREPGSIEELNNLVNEVFNSKVFFAAPVEALGEVQGVLMLLSANPCRQIRDWIWLLNRALSLQESEKRLHVMAVKDPATELLNRANFLLRVREEISRSRRTGLPVSVATIVLDQYGALNERIGLEEAQIVMKMAARIFEKHSRVNDVIGRTGPDEFGILLSHTHKQGALIKAERLRRIMESADFSRVVKAFPSITISIGVAEYPSMAHDAEELMQAADEALFQVRKLGNKTCVAKPPDNFVADFEVHSKGT